MSQAADDLTIDQQIVKLGREVESCKCAFEMDMKSLFEHVKVDNKMFTFPRMRDTIDAWIKASTTRYMLVLLSHPDRFELLATLAANIKERDDAQG